MSANDNKPRSDWASARGRLAVLTRFRAPDDPELVAARRDFKAGVLEEQIRETVESWPPLLPEQLDKLAVLLRPGGDK